MKCSSCGKTERSSTALPESVQQLCSECRKRFEAQHEYEKELPNFSQRLSVGDHLGALAVLDSIRLKLGHLNVDWLARSLLADRAMVLQAQGRWQEALVALKERLDMPFDDASEQASVHLGCAVVLHHLGQESDARAHMVALLDSLKNAHPQSALPKLLTWLETGDEAFFVDRADVVVAAIRAYGLEPPLSMAADPVGALKWAEANWVP